MWEKAKALPVDQDEKWTVVVQLLRNEAGQVRVDWNPEVFTDPDAVVAVLEMLRESAQDAQAELMSQPNAA